MQPEPVLTGGEIVAAADRCMFAYTGLVFSESFSSGYHCITSYSMSAKKPREM